MKKWNLILLFLTMATILNAQQTLHDFTVKDIYGEPFDMARLKGKKVMVVNTASKCGFTPQYKDMEQLYKTYKDKNFTIIGFPANNFLHQEPGTNEQIIEFCQLNYGVTFPMMAKISVKGKDIHPLYKWLTSKELNRKMDSKVKWNFQKYLVDEQGKLVDVVYSKESPLSDRIIEWIEN